MIGSEISGGIRNIYVHDCELSKTDMEVIIARGNSSNVRFINCEIDEKNIQYIKYENKVQILITR